MRPSVVIFILVVLALNCSAQRTTRKNLKLKEVADTTIVCDTLRNINTNIIEISGYDKPLNSKKETFFATNRGESTIVSIGITLNYFDNQKRQLHKVSKTINCSIPPSETRLLSIPSWDKQNSFYYHRSVQPRRQATPYSVTHSIDFVVTSK